jgi:hypothetical protein
MTTIEKHPIVLTLILLFAALLTILAGALALAYAGGVFTGKSEVMANDQRILLEKAQARP